MQKHFHNLVLGVSVLPALLVMPAMAESYTGHTGDQGALSSATGANITINEDVVFSGNTTTDHGAGFYYKNGGASSSVVFGSNVTFDNNEVLSSATSGSGAGMFVSGGNVSLLGNTNIFTGNEMNATIAESRKVKVGGGAIANQSYEKDMDPDKGTALDAIMVIGNSNSINTFTSNTSVTNGGAIMNRAMDDDGNATLTINGTTEFTGNHADINGGAIYNYQANGKTATVNLNNGKYTFTGNISNGGNGDHTGGGAIYTNGVLNVDNADFVSNKSLNGYGGGAIRVTGATSNTTIVNSKFTSNEALGGSQDAGAISLEAGQLTVKDSVFTSNKADEGGAIESYTTNNKMAISDSRFVGNEAKAYGAVAVFGNTGVNTITNSVFTGNKATDTTDGVDGDGGDAGAVFLGSSAKLKISGSTFGGATAELGNVAAGDGGAVSTRTNRQSQTASGLEIEKSTFTNNVAANRGGALYINVHKNTTGTGAASVANSTFNLNSANQGGAIFNDLKDSANNTSTLIVSSSVFSGNTATDAGGAIYNEGVFDLAGANTFTGNKAAGVANDIHNLGTLNIASGTTTIDGGITGDGTLTIAQGATLNIGKATITQGTINLGGTLIADLVADADHIFNVATEFKDEGGKLSLAIEKEGTYNLFSDKQFAKAQEQVTSSIYDLDWEAVDGSVVATKKSVGKIVEETGLSTGGAATVSVIADAAAIEEAPKQMKELSVKLQEKLAAGDTAAVEHATKAVHPETESVAQSVSTSVQNTVVNLASARMAAPSVGRNGGDVNFTSGGVWAQGLFNKSKQADAFNGYTRGIAVGLDGTINKHWTVGAGYSFAHSDITGTARDTEIDSNTVFLYGQYKPSAWYVNAIANYTMSDYSEKGTVLDNTPVFGDYDVNSFGGALATGYDFSNGITPELGLRYMHVNANDYANSYGIKTHTDDADFLTGVVGAKYAFNVAATKHTTFMPQLNAGLKYDLLSDKQVATVTMPGLNAYTLDGNRLNRVGGEFGIGLGMQYDNLEVSVNYDIDVRKDYTSQTGMLKFRCNF